MNGSVFKRCPRTEHQATCIAATCLFGYRIAGSYISKWRAFKPSDQILHKLAAHIKDLGLGPDDLLFTCQRMTVTRRHPVGPSDPSALGTFRVGKRNYRHGTATACGARRCHCDHCRHAVAAYRARHRQDGKDRPTSSGDGAPELDPHLENSTFRTGIFKPALTKAEIVDAAFHGLRHAHASWLLHGGADLEVVKKRLVTRRYPPRKVPSTLCLKPTRLPWRRSGTTADEQGSGDGATELEAAGKQIGELKAAIVDLSLKFSNADAKRSVA
jgi:hypothetical protein